MSWTLYTTGSVLTHLLSIFILGWLPKRYVFGIMGFLAVANAYSMRSVLSLAITEMVAAHHGRLGNKALIPDPNACPAPTSIAKNYTSDPVSSLNTS